LMWRFWACPRSGNQPGNIETSRSASGRRAFARICGPLHALQTTSGRLNAARVRSGFACGSTSSRFPASNEKSFDQISRVWAHVFSSGGAFPDHPRGDHSIGFPTRCAAFCRAIWRQQRWACMPLSIVMSTPRRSTLDERMATPAPWFHATQHGNAPAENLGASWASRAGRFPPEGVKSAVSAAHTCSPSDICDMGLEAACQVAFERATDGHDASYISFDYRLHRRVSCLVPGWPSPAAAAR